MLQEAIILRSRTPKININNALRSIWAIEKQNNNIYSSWWPRYELHGCTDGRATNELSASGADCNTYVCVASPKNLLFKSRERVVSTHKSATTLILIIIIISSQPHTHTCRFWLFARIWILFLFIYWGALILGNIHIQQNGWKTRKKLYNVHSNDDDYESLHHMHKCYSRHGEPRQSHRAHTLVIIA